jgi:hypothetical protein
MKRCYTILFILLAGALGGSTPQERYLRQPLERRAFDQETWAKTIDGIDYGAMPLPVTAAPPPTAPPPSAEPPAEPNQRAELILKILSIIIGTAAIAILLWAALTRERQPRNRKLRPAESGRAIRLEEIEANLLDTDLERFIQQALQQGDYALAVRLYYLAILKELSLRKLISWKKDKTNRQYLRELQPSPLAGAFQEATLIFERVWYGNRPLGEGEYRQIEPKFRHLAEAAKAPA